MNKMSVETVQDYPRPPRVEPVSDRLCMLIDGDVVAETRNGWRVCETHHAPTYYLPADAFAPGLLQPAKGTSFCEWKGHAAYFSLHWHGEIRSRGAWTYARPTPGYATITGHVAVYPWAVDAAFVGEERVQQQPGNFYGGWVTSNLRGTIKGAPGTEGW